MFYFTTIFFQILLLGRWIWWFHARCSSNKTPRDLILLVLSITTLSILRTTSLHAMSSFLLNLWRRVGFVLSVFRDLLALNRLLIWLSSLYAAFNRNFRSLLEYNKLVLPAKIVKSRVEADGRSLAYIKIKSGPNIDPCGTLHVIVRHLERLLLSYAIFCFVLLRSWKAKPRLFPQNYNEKILFKILWSTVSNAFFRSMKISKANKLTYLTYLIWKLNYCMICRITFSKSNFFYHIKHNF